MFPLAIPVLSGTNTDETTLWELTKFRVKNLEVAENYIEDPEPFINAVKKTGDISAGEIALAISTDHTFRIPAIRMAEARVSW